MNIFRFAKEKNQAESATQTKFSLRLSGSKVKPLIVTFRNGLFLFSLNQIRLLKKKHNDSRRRNRAA